MCITVCIYSCCYIRVIPIESEEVSIITVSGSAFLPVVIYQRNSFSGFSSAGNAFCIIVIIFLICSCCICFLLPKDNIVTCFVTLPLRIQINVIL